MKFRLIFIAGMAIVATGLYIWSDQPKGISEEELRSLGVIVLPELKTTPELNLVSHLGAPFTKSALQGKWSFAFFGYTHCPDICPVTMALIGEAEERLAERAESKVLARIRPVFVSVDAKRDGHAKVASFIAKTSNRFVGITGSAVEIKAFADFAGIGYKRMGSKTTAKAQEYLIEHQGYIAIFNQQGNLYGYIKPPFEVEHLVRIFIGLAHTPTQSFS